MEELISCKKVISKVVAGAPNVCSTAFVLLLSQKFKTYKFQQASIHLNLIKVSTVVRPLGYLVTKPLNVCVGKYS